MDQTEICYCCKARRVHPQCFKICMECTECDEAECTHPAIVL